MLLGQFFLLQVDQLSEPHTQDLIGLHTGECVPRRLAAFQYELLETLVAQGPLHHDCGALNAHQSLFGLDLSAAFTDRLDDFVDVCQSQQQAFDRVLAPSGTIEKELRSTTDHVQAVANELR